MNVHEVAKIVLQSILSRESYSPRLQDIGLTQEEAIAKEAFEVAAAFVLESKKYGLLHKKDEKAKEDFFNKTGIATIG